MPISPAGRRIERGVTLLELVVVMAILSVLALPAMLRFGAGVPAAEAVAARLDADLARLRDRALFSRQVAVMQPGPQGWDAARFDGLDLAWEVAGRPGPAPIRLYPDGSGTPFALRIGAGGPVCRFDGWNPPGCAP